MVFFLHTAKIIKMVCLSEYSKLEGLPHGSFDVFFHGELISGRYRSVWSFYTSLLMCYSHHKLSPLPNIFGNFLSFYWIVSNFLHFLWVLFIFVALHWLYSSFSEILWTCWWHWALQMSPRCSQAVLKHSKMECSCKNTSKLWCGSPLDSKYSQR